MSTGRKTEHQLVDLMSDPKTPPEIVKEAMKVLWFIIELRRKGSAEDTAS